MPKLPLDRETMKLLPGIAIDAARHPRRTASQVVNGSINVVGHLLERRQATEPVPGMASPPPVAAEPGEVDDTVEDLAPEAPDDTYAEPVAANAEPAQAPVEPDDPDVEPVDTDAEPLEAPEEDEGPTDVHPEGPAPHMRPRIAGDVERDYEEDIPGITGHRER